MSDPELKQALLEIIDSLPVPTVSGDAYMQGWNDALREIRLRVEPFRAPVLDVPHPRTRIYRSEPAGWSIRDVTIDVIKDKLGAAARAAKRPATVVLDLDGTLFDVGHRTLGILKEWLGLPAARKYSRETLQRVGAIDFCHIGYSLAHAFENVGLDIETHEIGELYQECERHWRKRFFDGKTLVDFDHPVAGAPDFVAWCRMQGLEIVYLTGRFDARMLSGTRAQLVKFGFPVDGCELVLKPDTLIEDHVFKQDAFARLCTERDVVGNFENEYVNIGVMAASASECIHVIVDTQHSGRPVSDVTVPVYRISDFS